MLMSASDDGSVTVCSSSLKFMLEVDNLSWNLAEDRVEMVEVTT